MCLVLGGCNGSAPSGSPAPTTSTTANGLTAPGSALSWGDSAKVTPTDGSAIVELTVTGIDRGTTADLQGAGYADAEADAVYYVRYQVRLTAGDPQGLSLRRNLSAWADDEPAATLVLSERFAPCQERDLPAGATPGTAITSCRPFLTDRGAAPVDTVRFRNDDIYDSATGNDIAWR